MFSGTKVPVRILIEHLEAGDRLDDFLDTSLRCRGARQSKCSTRQGDDQVTASASFSAV